MIEKKVFEKMQKALNRKLLIYSDSVQGTVKAAIPLYRT